MNDDCNTVNAFTVWFGFPALLGGTQDCTIQDIRPVCCVLFSSKPLSKYLMARQQPQHKPLHSLALLGKIETDDVCDTHCHLSHTLSFKTSLCMVAKYDTYSDMQLCRVFTRDGRLTHEACCRRMASRIAVAY